MHKPIWEDRFEIDKRGQVMLVVNARGKGLDKSNRLTINCSFDCCKFYESGKIFVRNMYYTYMGGYFVEYPQEYKYTYVAKEKVLRGYDRYYRAQNNINLPSFGFTKWDADIILSKYPAFKYVIDKWKGYHTKRDVFNILQVWKEHPEIELPLSLGYEKVCYTKSFFTLKKTMLKKLYKIMSENRGADYTLSDLRFLVSHTKEELKLCKEMRRVLGRNTGVELARWASKNVTAENKYNFADIYKVYLNRCKYIGKDIKDPFWSMPKDFETTRAMVNNQYDNMKALEEKEKADKQIKTYLQKIDRFVGKYDREIGGYSIFIPTTSQQWIEQAEKLHQCIVRMNYIDKCYDNYIIVFIHKDGQPVATCEINNVLEKKIGQFYADEEDRNNCYPTEETKQAMYKWLEDLEVA